jgi:hypothetical protein
MITSTGAAVAGAPVLVCGDTADGDKVDVGTEEGVAAAVEDDSVWVADVEGTGAELVGADDPADGAPPLVGEPWPHPVRAMHAVPATRGTVINLRGFGIGGNPFRVSGGLIRNP